jgi:hypothetical protein
MLVLDVGGEDMRIRFLVVSVLVAAVYLTGCQTTGQTTVPAGSTTSASTTVGSTETTVKSIGIQEIISAEEIGQILGVTPTQYDETVKPNSERKIGRYTFDMTVAQGAKTYLELGIITGSDVVARFGYRDPATPRSGSEMTEYTVLGSKAYLDAQIVDALIDGKTVKVVNNYQFVCVIKDVYYYLSSGYFTSEQVENFKNKQPVIMQKLIENAKLKIK